MGLISRILTPIVIAGALFSPKAFAEEGVNIRFNAGLEFLNFGDKFKYYHETHPDDSSFLTGSPGSTCVKNAYGLKLGGEIGVKSEVIEPYAGVNLLFLNGRDQHQNDNDFRPKGSQSEVYSAVRRFAPQIDFGARAYLVDEFSIGADVSATYITVEHGWNRYGMDKKVKSESACLVNAGVNVNYHFTETSVLKAGVSKGVNNESTIFSLGVGLDF